MPDAVCLGELLIDFVSTTTDVALGACPGFHKAPGGAPANVAAGLARLGVSAGFIGKVGDDPFGEMLRNTLRSETVDTHHLIVGKQVRTTLAFVATRRDGRKDIAFWRHPGADILLSREELDLDYIRAARIFHFGSVSLSHSPAREATLAAAQAAREGGLLVSYDPNVRLPLWDDADEAHRWIGEAMRFAHVVKLAKEEWEFVTRTDDFNRGSERVRAAGPRLVVMTSGARGCSYQSEEAQGRLQGFAVDAIDPLGAGDAFVAGMLSQLLATVASSPDQSSAEALELCLGATALERILVYANACGALATRKVGAIPALPAGIEVEGFLRDQQSAKA